MPLQRNLEIVTERLNALMTFAHPFGTKLADQICLRKLMRENAPANAVTRFENGDIPTGGF